MPTKKNYVKPTIETCIQAILDRSRGEPYSLVLIRHSITPNKFYRVIVYGIDDILREAQPSARPILQAIKADDDRVTALLTMEEEFIRQQYCNVLEGRQPKFFEGSFSHKSNGNITVHSENVENIAYCALTYHHKDHDHKKLESLKREKVVEATSRVIRTKA